MRPQFNGEFPMTKRQPSAPGHLRTPTRKWFESVVENYALEQHHERLLQVAGEAWDRAQLAREALRRHGLVYQDRFGAPKQRPEVAIGRDAMVVFMRAVRELRLDVGQPAEDERPPRIPERRG
jgi:phage terminase small subunit